METVRKKSRKREAMLAALRATTEHPTAEMLYNTLKPEYPELSLGTVYRNLSVLAEEGLVVSVAHVNGQERYDARVEPHTHFICRRCARVIDLLELEDAISGMYGEIKHRFGCLPESHTLTVSGLCPNCCAAAE